MEEEKLSSLHDSLYAANSARGHRGGLGKEDVLRIKGGKKVSSSSQDPAQPFIKFVKAKASSNEPAKRKSSIATADETAVVAATAAASQRPRTRSNSSLEAPESTKRARARSNSLSNALEPAKRPRKSSVASAEAGAAESCKSTAAQMHQLAVAPNFKLSSFASHLFDKSIVAAQGQLLKIKLPDLKLASAQVLQLAASSSSLNAVLLTPQGQVVTGELLKCKVGTSLNVFFVA